MLRKATVLANVVAQVSARHQIDDQVEIVTVFIRKVHVYQESNTEIVFKLSTEYLRMIKLAEELFLVHDGVNASF